MRIHIIGICGTFMGGVALLARQLGYQVSGSDQNVYPPMSTQLENAGIELKQGYSEKNLQPNPDLVVIGNAMSRGNREVEAVLNLRLAYTSGPGWLAEFLLKDRWVLAVAGTHGKTTTASMLTWILEDQGFDPGFLIGGVPKNFNLSARLGSSPYFVVEADEYDTAFFDKRSKFVHYRPRTAVLNNLEFDHADIFPDLSAIKTQFHHFVRTIPGNGLIVFPKNDRNLEDVIAMGCWSHVEETSIDSVSESAWAAQLKGQDETDFEVLLNNKTQGRLSWEFSGRHNVNNALSAIAAAHHVGISAAEAIDALGRFQGVRRRMDIIAHLNGVTIYDDFAHHPTAIKSTLEGLRRKVNRERIIAILEPRSNTMRLGIHKEQLVDSLKSADLTYIYMPSRLEWDIKQLTKDFDNIVILDSIDEIVAKIPEQIQCGGHVVIMSNGGFGGIHQRLEAQLKPS